MKEPFFSSIFTLSSHHPYRIPERYQGQFPKGNLPIHESIGYADHSLKQFFERVKNEAWYKNTLFVFTADHASLSETAEYKTKQGRFAIPIFVFDPINGVAGQDSSFFQQLDITPTLLNLLGIETTIVTFGNNPLTSESDENPYVVNYVNGVYQFAQGNYFLLFDGEQTWNFFNLEKDPLLTKNIMKELTPEEIVIHQNMETQLKGIIQQYQYRIVNNQLSVEHAKP